MKELIISIFAQFGILFPFVVICTYAVCKYFTDKNLVKKLTEYPSVSIILIAACITVMIMNIWFSISGSTETPIMVKSWVDFIVFTIFMSGLSISSTLILRVDELPEKVTGIISDLILLVMSILTIPVSSDLVSFLRLIFTA